MENLEKGVWPGRKHQELGVLSSAAALTILSKPGILYAFLSLPAIQMMSKSEPHTIAE